MSAWVVTTSHVSCEPKALPWFIKARTLCVLVFSRMSLHWDQWRWMRREEVLRWRGWGWCYCVATRWPWKSINITIRIVTVSKAQFENLGQKFFHHSETARCSPLGKIRLSVTIQVVRVGISLLFAERNIVRSHICTLIFQHAICTYVNQNAKQPWTDLCMSKPLWLEHPRTKLSATMLPQMQYLHQVCYVQNCQTYKYPLYAQYTSPACT